MILMNLYDNIKNPLENSNVIKKLISAYERRRNFFGGFYSALTNTVKKEYNGHYNDEDVDKFYSIMFNKWKNSIVSMTKSEFNELYKRGSYGRDFIRMRNYLLNVSDVSTREEADSILFGNKGDKELETALDKYRWNSFGEDSGWIHVCSRYLTAKKDEYPNVEHRLYLNAECPDIYKLITLFSQKCDEHHLPYYFKFDEFGGRDDSIVIYSSTENLSDYIEILREIQKEHSDLVSRMKEPPVLTGLIDGFIGYGSEPKRTSSGELQSFNEVRSDVIKNAISKVFQKYVSENYDITRNDLLLIISELICENSKKKYYDRLKSLKRRATKYGEKFDPNDLFNYFGYRPEDIDSDSFKQLINRIVSSEIDKILQCYVCGNKIGSIKIPVSNGNFIYFYNLNIIKCIDSYITERIIQNEDYITKIKKQIDENIEDTDIDLAKFCFDKHVIPRFQEVDSLKSSNDSLKNSTNSENNIIYDDKLNEEFLKLLQELKKPSYDRKERSKFVVRIEQIIDIYRNDIHNDEFADTLVKAFNNAQAVYERELSMKDSVSKGKHLEASKPKHFKKIELSQDKSVSLSEDMESKIDEESLRKVQAIDDKAYKTSSQKVDEMLDKKMAEIYERVDNGETLDSKIDDLSRYVNDLNKRRAEINDQFKDAWILGDEDKFDKLLSEDNRTKALISKNQAEIERRVKIRDIVDEQIAREEVTQDLERYASDVDFVNNSDLTDEQKKLNIDGIYAEFDKYVEEHPEDKGRIR